MRNFLAHFSIDIGDVEIKQLDMNITQLSCAGVDLGPISSTLQVPKSDGIKVSVTGTTTRCTGSWAHRHLITHKMSRGPFSIGVQVGA